LTTRTVPIIAILIFLGVIFVAGGTRNFRADLDFTETIDLNDGSTGTCSSLAGPPGTGYDQGPVVTFSSGQLFLCGGYDDNGPLSTCYSYNTINDTWTPRFPLDQPRWEASSIQLSDHEWWITGGDGGHTEGMTSTVLYNTDTNLVTPYIPLPIPMWRHSMVKIDEDRIFIIGGSSPWATMDTNAYIFYKSSETFDDIGHPLDYDWLLGFTGLVTKPDGRKQIVLTGGNALPERSYIYDLTDGEWTRGPNFPPAIAHGSSAPFGNSFVTLGGFQESSGDQMDEIWTFDVNSEEWVKLPQTLSLDREYTSAVPVPVGFISC